MKVLGDMETRRLGRAIEGLVSGQYRWQQVVVIENAVIRGYVQRMEGDRFHNEYAVQIAKDGSRGWCSCRDYFVGGHQCKHIAIAALALAQQQSAVQPADNRSRGAQRPRVVGA
ncbi:SWIM zinc finger family protein [Desulfolucanica intricata]|uniref:SWIM zinc finger family protein n=1 Tax=Desulfolucanica intricata TaxID=1285191 RepID=UPI000829F3B7|nr:SWIM zinc finger family protein [Desulfolucanica intricata]